MRMGVDGRYRMEERLGAGAQGEAWRAHDLTLDRPVVIKRLRLPEGLSAEQQATMVARAGREARAAGRLSHPGIVTVHDLFPGDDGLPWIVMEYVNGTTLEARISEGPLSVGEAAAIGAHAAAALAAAHAAGIVHRDIKPANVLLSGDRTVIADFGIARVLDEGTLTPEGMVIGTPAYMAPEHITRGLTSPASDIWSLAATLHHAVEGQRPFRGDTTGALALAISSGQTGPRPRSGTLGPVLAQMMRTHPSARPTAAAAADLLRQIANGASTTGSRPTRIDGASTAEVQSLLDRATRERDDGALDRAEDLYWAALDLAIVLGSRAQQGWAWDGLGSCRWRSKDPTMATRFFTRALAIGEEVGDTHLQAWSLSNVGVGFAGHDAQAAKSSFRRALALAREHDHLAALGWTSHELAALLRADDPDAARDLYRTALEAGDALGDLDLTGWSLIHLAESLEEGDGEAAALFDRALAIGRDKPNRWMKERAEKGLAHRT
ncbi:protein kinase domain-containing protein [Spirillospora sp. CA-253888]